MTNDVYSFWPLVLRLGSAACLSLVWVGAILWCAVRYDKAPARYASTAALFAVMLVVQLTWPLLRGPIGQLIMAFGIPMDGADAGLGALGSLLLIGLPALALTAIALQTEAPTPS